MKRGSLVLLVCLLAVPATSVAADGFDVMTRHGCLACHTLDGGASVGPTLQGVVERTSADHVRRAIVEPGADVADGYPAGMMPAYTIAEADVDAIVSALSAPIPEEEVPRAGSMASLAAAAVLFVALHLLMSSGWIRPRLVGLVGESAFQGVYSLIVLGVGVWAWFAWQAAPHVELWPAVAWTRWVPNVGMPIAYVLIVAGYTTNSPTVAGLTGSLAGDDPARGILRVSRHPANVGMTLFGLVHLFPNGDLAAVLFFGAIVALGVLGTWHIERRRRATHGEAWERFAQRTSIVPFAAILRGDQHLSLREIAWWRIAAGLGGWLALLLLHRWLIGASPWPIAVETWWLAR